MRDRRILPLSRSPALRRPLNRRTFLFGAAATLAVGRGLGAGRTQPGLVPGAGDTPFTLGVASGEPLPDGVVLWTRLAPLPFEPFGGMPLEPVEVGWVVAEDERFDRVVQQGTATADPEWAHAIHVEVSGLRPDRWYWYRFTAGSEISPAGRTRTAPPRGALTPLRFAVASCQRWDHGLYTAYRDMATQDLDLVVHLGDYIYESQILANEFRDATIPDVAFAEPHDLDGYRVRHALHKLDPDLQEAHRLFPWLVTWDDHEVHNNVYGALDRESASGQQRLERRAAAYQAYYEHQPLRRQSIPVGPDLRLYRRRAFGSLVEFAMLDTRQYRNRQGMSCGDASRRDNGGFCPDALEGDRTMLGAEQKRWLLDGLAATTARWNVLAQQVPMARIDTDPLPDVASYGGKDLDTWDGYAVERNQVLATLAEVAAAGGFTPVVLTGDTHSNAVWDLKTDWDDRAGASTVAAEFVGTSISSGGDEPVDEDGGFTTVCGGHNGNPHNRLFDNHRGYMLCAVSPDQWRTEYRVLPTVRDPNVSASTLTSFVVEHGHPAAQVDTTCATSKPG